MPITAVIKGLNIGPNGFTFNVSFRIPGEENIREQIAIPKVPTQTLEQLQGVLVAQVKSRIGELTRDRTVATQITAWVGTQPTVVGD